MGAEITETSQEAMFGHLARRHGIWTDLLVGIATGRYSDGWCDWTQLLGQTEQIVQGRDLILHRGLYLKFTRFYFDIVWSHQ